MVTKVTFVGENFTRKPPKFERFIRPMGLRFKKAHVTHPELKVGVLCAPYCSRGGRRILLKGKRERRAKGWNGEGYRTLLTSPAFVPVFNTSSTLRKNYVYKNLPVLVAGYFLPAHHWCKEEPQQSHVHQLRQVYSDKFFKIINFIVLRICVDPHLLWLLPDPFILTSWIRSQIWIRIRMELKSWIPRICS